MLRLRLAATAAALALTLPTMGHAQTPRDVPAGHWAYAAVTDLASKGLIKGYPPNGDFFGGRTVTRYEMASIIDRVLEQLQQTPASQVSQAQLDEVRKLVDEYHVELTVIGSRMDAVEKDVQGLKDRADQQDTAIADAKQGVQSALDAITEQAARIAAANKASAAKVDAGFGKIKLDGDVQGWFMSGKNVGGTGVDSTFRLRRAEIKLSGDINPKAYWWTMFDPAKTLSLNTTPLTGGGLSCVSVNQASNILQELVAGYRITPQLALEVGQQKVPMSMEGWRSATQLLTIERSLMNLLPINNGRVGDIRDVGAMLRLSNPTVDAQLALYDDAGNRQNQQDDNSAKELMYQVQYKGIQHLMLGAYQEISGGVNGAAKTKRPRFGLEGSFNLGPHTLEVEAVRAGDGAPRINSEGGYVTYAYRFSPKWQAVAREDYWNPNRDLKGDQKNYERDTLLGLNYYLTNHNSKIQFNWVDKKIHGPLNAAGTGPAALPSLGVSRNQYILAFLTAY